VALRSRHGLAKVEASLDWRRLSAKVETRRRQQSFSCDHGGGVRAVWQPTIGEEKAVPAAALLPDPAMGRTRENERGRERVNERDQGKKEGKRSAFPFSERGRAGRYAQRGRARCRARRA
jgi:hypothetical protein